MVIELSSHAQHRIAERLEAIWKRQAKGAMECSSIYVWARRRLSHCIEKYKPLVKQKGKSVIGFGGVRWVISACSADRFTLVTAMEDKHESEPASPLSRKERNRYRRKKQRALRRAE